MLEELACLLVVACHRLEQPDRRPVGRAVAERCDREPPDGVVAVVRGELVQERTHRVDDPGRVAGELLQRQQGGAAAGRALVLEAAAERRRQQLRQAANDFVQLVAVGLTTDQSVEEAIRFAVRVGGSPAFQMLRREIQSAPQRGVAVWEAIEEFGRTNGIRELVDFATAVERQGVQGVSIGESVASLSASMRAASFEKSSALAAVGAAEGVSGLVTWPVSQSEGEDGMSRVTSHDVG